MPNPEEQEQQQHPCEQYLQRIDELESTIESLTEKLAEAQEENEDLKEDKMMSEGEADNLRGAAELWNAELAEEFPPTGDSAPFPVFVARMLKRGASYCAESGIWWSSESKPGILRELEEKLAASEARVEKLEETIKFQKAKIERLCNRGIEDMKDEIKQLQIKNEDLNESLKHDREFLAKAKNTEGWLKNKFR